MPYKASFLQSISCIMRFDFKKIFFARFFSNKVTKELDGYELY